MIKLKQIGYPNFFKILNHKFNLIQQLIMKTNNYQQ